MTNVTHWVDHLCEQRLWIWPHVKVFQLKAHSHSGHLDLFICIQTNTVDFSEGENSNCSLGSKMNSPNKRGWRTVSERRLTTVSRPFTSADTAYMVVSLNKKRRITVTDRRKQSHSQSVLCFIHFVTRPNGVNYLDVWQSQIPPCFSNVRRISSLLPYCAVD